MIHTITKIFDETFPNRALLSKDDLICKLNDLINKLEQDADSLQTQIDSLKDLSLMDDLELSFLYLYMQVCYAKENRIISSPIDREELSEDFLKTLPCLVFFSKKYSCLLIDTPVILSSFRNPNGKMQENIVRSLVLTAIKKYELDNDFKFALSIKQPYCLGMFRRCLKGQSSTVVPDIDNIETRRILNSLTDVLSLDDSYSSLISNVNSIEFVEDKKDCGTTILLVEERKRIELEKEFIKNKRSFSFIRNGNNV